MFGTPKNILPFSIPRYFGYAKNPVVEIEMTDFSPIRKDATEEINLKSITLKDRVMKIGVVSDAISACITTLFQEVIKSILFNSTIGLLAGYILRYIGEKLIGVIPSWLKTLANILIIAITLFSIIALATTPAGLPVLVLTLATVFLKAAILSFIFASVLLFCNNLQLNQISRMNQLSNNSKKLAMFVAFILGIVLSVLTGGTFAAIVFTISLLIEWYFWKKPKAA